MSITDTFDFKEFSKRRKNNLKFEKLLAKTNDNKFYQLISNKYAETCSHSLVIQFGEWESLEGYGICACCGKKFEVANSKGSLEYSNHLFNISYFISNEFVFEKNENNKELMLLKVQEILNKLAITTANMRYDELYIILQNSLKDYEQELLSKKNARK